MASVRLARMAMASRFELILEGDDEPWLRAAGEEALSEIERLDRQLTIFSPSSDVSRINARAAQGPVSVEPRLFALLMHCRRLTDETDGAFDITVAALMRAWGFYRGSGRVPADEALERAHSVTGMHLVHLDEERRTVAFEREGVLLDFGAIGKGYAIDEAAAILREAGVERAFLHGGTSTAVGIGRQEDGRPWRVALPYPGDTPAPLALPSSERELQAEVDLPSSDSSVLAVVPLEDASLSVSAVWGKAFEVDGRTLGHVLDPRIGRPVEGALMTAAVGASATEADALSTALLVLGRDGEDLMRSYRNHLKMLSLFAPEEHGAFEVIESDLPTIPSQRHYLRALPH